MIKQLTFVVSLFVAGFVSAQTITWNGLGATNNFSEGGNWVGGVAPTSTNAALFNGTGTKNCTIDASVSVIGFTVSSAYSGIITGSNQLIVVNGTFAQAGGTFDSTSDSLIIATGHFSLTGGTFNAGTGNVIMKPNASSTGSIIGTPTFNRLYVRPNSATTSQRVVHYGNCTTSSLTVDGPSHIFAFSSSVNIVSSLDMNGTANVFPTSNTGTLFLGGVGNVSVTVPINASSGRNKLPNLVFNTTGTISISGNLSLTGNWSHVSGVFAYSTPTQVTHFFGSSETISGTGNQFCGVTVQGGSTVNFPSSTEVKFSGTLNQLGTFNFPSSTLVSFNGTDAGGQVFNNRVASNTISIGAVRIYSASASRNVTFARDFSNSGFRILDSLKIDAGGGNIGLITNNTILLESTSALTSRIARLGSNASITGSVTVRRFIPGGLTGWANLGAPGVRNQTFANWDTWFSSSGANGIPMTCTGCTYGPTGSGGYFVSVQGWNEATNLYTELQSTTSLVAGTGYWVYLGTAAVNTGSLLTINNGTLVQGNQTVAVSNSSTGYNLVANPYASPINWQTVFAASTNVANAIYIWNADLNVETSFVGGVSSHGSGANKVIPAGQGFHVQATSSGAQVVFTEAAKISDNTSANPLLRGASESEDIGDVFRLKFTGASSADAMAFRIHPEASSRFDEKWDAMKRLQTPGYLGYPGPYTKYTTISSKDLDGTNYGIHSIAPLTTTMNIPVMTRVETSGTYTIEAIDAENAGACLFIKDKVTGLQHDLTQSAYVFTISDTTQAPRFELLLCPRYAQNPNAIAELTKNNSVQVGHENGNLLVKTNFTSTTVGTISVFNLLGQQVIAPIRFNEQSQLHTIAVEGSNDVLMVRITTDEGTITRKVMMK